LFIKNEKLFKCGGFFCLFDPQYSSYFKKIVKIFSFKIFSMFDKLKLKKKFFEVEESFFSIIIGQKNKSHFFHRKNRE